MEQGFKKITSGTFNGWYTKNEGTYRAVSKYRDGKEVFNFNVPLIVVDNTDLERACAIEVATIILEAIYIDGTQNKPWDQMQEDIDNSLRCIKEVPFEFFLNNSPSIRASVAARSKEFSKYVKGVNDQQNVQLASAYCKQFLRGMVNDAELVQLNQEKAAQKVSDDFSLKK